MEAQAHETPALQQGPHNLAAWLRKQGFTVTEAVEPDEVWGLAQWVGPQQDQFNFTYTYQRPSGPGVTCWLMVRYPDDGQPETLFTAQQVRRLRDARRLLTGCMRYAEARLLARPAAPVSTTP